MLTRSRTTRIYLDPGPRPLSIPWPSFVYFTTEIYLGEEKPFLVIQESFFMFLWMKTNYSKNNTNTVAQICWSWSKETFSRESFCFSFVLFPVLRSKNFFWIWVDCLPKQTDRSKFLLHLFWGIQLPKPSLQIGTANAICWNSLGLFWDYGLNYILLGIKLFCFSR